MPDWEKAKALGLELPDTLEGTSYGTPALKVRDKMFARLREDGETLVVWTDFLEREARTTRPRGHKPGYRALNRRLSWRA